MTNDNLNHRFLVYKSDLIEAIHENNKELRASVDKSIEQCDKKIEQTNIRMDRLEAKFDRLEGKVDRLFYGIIFAIIVPIALKLGPLLMK